MFDEGAYRAEEAKLWKVVGATPKEHRVKLANVGAVVRVQDVGEGKPVLFVHGGPNSGSTWAAMIPHLPGFRCLLLDRPGTGLSAPLPKVPTPADLNALGDAIVADVLDALEVERAHVVASSFGGFLSLRSAAKHGDRVDRMVQMACPAFCQGMKTPTFMRFMSLGIMRALIGRMEPTVKAGKDILRQIGHGASIDAGRIPEPFFEWYVALQKHTDTMVNDGAMIGNAMSFFSGPHPSLTLTDELLGSIRTETFFYWGADDAFGGKDVADGLVRAMPNAKLEMVPRAGHLPWLDDAEAAARATREFLSAS